MNRKIKFTPKLFITTGLILTVAILLSVMLLKSTQENKNTIIPTPTPNEVIINPDQNIQAKEKVTNLAIDDLSKTENIAKESITVASVQETEWSDASLGCRKPGGFYAQVITPGYTIILETQGKEYTYNTSLKRVVRCN